MWGSIKRLRPAEALSIHVYTYQGACSMEHGWQGARRTQHVTRSSDQAGRSAQYSARSTQDGWKFLSIGHFNFPIENNIFHHAHDDLCVKVWIKIHPCWVLGAECSLLRVSCCVCRAACSELRVAYSVFRAAYCMLRAASSVVSVIMYLSLETFNASAINEYLY